MVNTVGSRLRNIIIGTLLGDAILERNGNYTRLVIDHSSSQEEYVKWKSERLNTFCPSVKTKERFDNRTRKMYSHCILRTHTSPTFEDYVQLFYQERRKIIPRELPIIINPHILAVWIMDDGYRRNDCRAMRLNTQGYNFEEQKIIVSSLSALQISSTIQKHKNSFVVYIPSQSIETLEKIVRRFIIPSMKYKIA